MQKIKIQYCDTYHFPGYFFENFENVLFSQDRFKPFASVLWKRTNAIGKKFVPFNFNSHSCLKMFTNFSRLEYNCLFQPLLINQMDQTV